MSQFLIPPTRLISYPGIECPSLVKLEVNHGNRADLQLGYKPSDVGFVVSSQLGHTIIWGHSWFLYYPGKKDYLAKGLAGLRKGKVSVIRQDKENYGRSYDGVVTYIDFNFHLAIILVTDPNWISIKDPSTLGGADFPIDKHLISMDLDCIMNTYSVEPYTLISTEGDDDDDESLFHKCGPYYHVDWDSMNTPGVLLDINHNIVGIKFGLCPLSVSGHSEKLAHVLPIKEFAAKLHEKSQSNDHTDIRLCSNDMEDYSRCGLGYGYDLSSSTIPFVDHERGIEDYYRSLESFERRIEDLTTQLENQDRQLIEARIAGASLIP